MFRLLFTLSLSLDVANPQLLAVLQNLTAFHTQFIEPVCKQKDKLREPLEKEFKVLVWVVKKTLLYR